MSKPDGGPAFPVERCVAGGPYIGMTIRDYFAAKAMTSVLVSEQSMQEITVTRVGNPLAVLDDVAAISYGMADAMLTARGK